MRAALALGLGALAAVMLAVGLLMPSMGSRPDGQPSPLPKIGRAPEFALISQDAAPVRNGDVGHTFLTSIIDRNGVLRVQYLGARFDPDEFRRDLLSLAREE
jgi:hypothetical protein